MTLIEFAREYRALRALQDAYFVARHRGMSGSRELERARETERDLDAKADRVLSDPSLPFDVSGDHYRPWRDPDIAGGPPWK